MAVPSRAPQILVGNIIPQIFASLFVIARMITKIRITRAWGADDTVLVIAWLCSLALTILACLETRYGAGKHLHDVPFTSLEAGLNLEYGTRITYFLALGFTKVSICLFYLRVFRERYSRIIAMGTMGFTILFTVPTVLVSIFQCNPVRGFWDKTIKSTCFNTNPNLYASAACNIAADTVLIILVVFSVLPLKLVRRQKIVLLIVISSGWL
ncbi:hypothetical protein LAWI1_G004021 [Lachnellula willkommii]|uniref:Rhodopsin domain-containing protein n=1 Tax=Lachnellula willkommii TaxID=215461 RepID=A0A559MIE8_9HELO|nr:hypothetical protein LAWI1_G004021 [Lachnellula willkommii]